MTIIDIAKDLPETLSKWDLFVSTYYSQVGTVIKFVKIDDSHWSILKETEREVWTVGKWSQVCVRNVPVIIQIPYKKFSL